MSLSTPEQAFHELARIFSARHNHSQTLEIEILPPGFGSLLQDECCVGIAKKVLVQAFVAARQVFFEKEDEDKTGKQYEEENLLRSSEILLLFAPEYLTACNWRKRRLIWILQNTSTNTDAHRQDILEILNRELTLMATYLCSYLHRHTKSPTLWQHRLWVLRQILSVRAWASQDHHNHPIPQQKGPLTPETLRSILQSELSIVLRSGELHPRNYYAFSYMRQLHTFLLLPPDTTIKPKHDDISTSLLDKTVSWCLAHPRDISGWMFTLYLLERIPECRDVQARVINMVVRFALDFGWVGESIWTFVDLAVRMTGVDDAVRDLLQFSAGGDDGLSGRSWKTWLARAEAYWTAGRIRGRNQEKSQA